MDDEIQNGEREQANAEKLWPASAVGENTLLYMEGFRCAFAGTLFGEMTAQFAFADGMMALEENGLSLRLQLQEDGFLRMTVSADGEIVLILRPAETEGFPNRVGRS